MHAIGLPPLEQQHDRHHDEYQRSDAADHDPRDRARAELVKLGRREERDGRADRGVQTRKERRVERGRERRVQREREWWVCGDVGCRRREVGVPVERERERGRAVPLHDLCWKRVRGGGARVEKGKGGVRDGAVCYEGIQDGTEGGAVADEPVHFGGRREGGNDRHGRDVPAGPDVVREVEILRSAISVGMDQK